MRLNTFAFIMTSICSVTGVSAQPGSVAVPRAGIGEDASGNPVLRFYVQFSPTLFLTAESLAAAVEVGSSRSPSVILNERLLSISDRWRRTCTKLQGSILEVYIHGLHQSTLHIECVLPAHRLLFCSFYMYVISCLYWPMGHLGSLYMSWKLLQPGEDFKMTCSCTCSHTYPFLSHSLQSAIWRVQLVMKWIGTARAVSWPASA